MRFIRDSVFCQRIVNLPRSVSSAVPALQDELHFQTDLPKSETQYGADAAQNADAAVSTTKDPASFKETVKKMMEQAMKKSVASLSSSELFIDCALRAPTAADTWPISFNTSGVDNSGKYGIFNVTPLKLLPRMAYRCQQCS